MNMNLKRVSQDFPTIVVKYVNMTKIRNLDTKTLDAVTLPMAIWLNKLGYRFQVHTLRARNREFKSLYPDTLRTHEPLQKSLAK